MTAKLYKLDLSPPARAAMMACEIFDFPAEMIDVNVISHDNYTPEYLQMNPIHSVPVLIDGDLTIHDSHAILMYLADAYGHDDSLYPKDLKKRTKVNQMLFFDTAIIFPRLRNVTYPLLVEGEKGPFNKQLKAVEEAYGMLEAFLWRSKYIAGDVMTIADIATFPNVQAFGYIKPIDVSNESDDFIMMTPPEIRNVAQEVIKNLLLEKSRDKYPKTVAWIKDMEKQPFCLKINAPGAETLRVMCMEKISNIVIV